MKKQVYRVLKKVVYEFARINDPVYGCEKDRVVTTDEENSKIVPQKGEIDKIVSEILIWETKLQIRLF